VRSFTRRATPSGVTFVQLRFSTSNCVRPTAVASDVSLAISLFVDGPRARRGSYSGSLPGFSEPNHGTRVTRGRRERDLPAFRVFRLSRKNLRQFRARIQISPVRRRFFGVRVRPPWSYSGPRSYAPKPLSISG
jgi:hypothetical protein